MGSIDRIIRLMVATLLVVLSLTSVIHGVWGLVMLIIAGILVLTSLFSICPLYWIFGIDTCQAGKQ